MKHVLLASLSIGLIAQPAVVSGQATTIHSLEREPCQECRITMDTVAVLRDANTPLHFTDRVIVSYDPAWSRLYVVSYADRAVIGSYDMNGVFHESFGRSGKGPGEFQFVVNVASGRGDSLYVTDVLAGRITIMDSALRYVRDMSLPTRAVDIVVHGDGSFTISGPLGSESAAGYPFHHFDQRGAYVRSFGDIPTGIATTNPGLRRRMTRATGDEFWTVIENRYVVQKYSAGRGLVATYAGSAEWITEREREGNPIYDRPRGTITTVGVDGEYLWITGQAADAAWRPRMIEHAGETGPGLSSADQDSLYDTIVEVIDLSRRRIIASRRLPRHYWNIAGSALLMNVDLDENLEPYVVILRPRLRRP